MEESDEPERLQSVVGPVCESGDFLGKEEVVELEHFFSYFYFPSQGCSLASLPSWQLVGRDGHRRLRSLDGNVWKLVSFDTDSDPYGHMSYHSFILGTSP